MDAVRRRRDRKIIKLYRKLAVRHDDRLERRLRCLQQAEANALRKNFEKSIPLDRAEFEEDLRRAKEVLEKHESDHR